MNDHASRPLSKINLVQGMHGPEFAAARARYLAKIPMREALYDPCQPNAKQLSLIGCLSEFGYSQLVKASLGGHLTFQEAFAATCYILRASNGHLERRFHCLKDASLGPDGDCMAAREMLSGLAMKEAWAELTPDEVAGMVTAAQMDIIHFPDYGPRVLETCGMGGDRGMMVNGDPVRRKTINCSTLSALTVASLGHRTAKHGSYSNTSAVGSTEAIENLGVIVDIPKRDVQEELAMSGFHFTDAHAWKTIHDLSHLLPRRETVNHVIGPMTPPVSPATRLDKVIGVNEKMHPETIARAYARLHADGVYNVGNVAVVCGLSQHIDAHEAINSRHIRDLAVLDELSPFASLMSFTARDEFLANVVLTPASFGLMFRDPMSVFVPNEEAMIMEANRIAVHLGCDDRDRQLVEYLAMNAGLALYLTNGMMDDDLARFRAGRGPDSEKLAHCAWICLEALREGRVSAFLASQVQLTCKASGRFNAQ
ncbi:MAG: hypothetical protein AAB337_00890 [Patescibacteria group bacterium]